MICRLSSPYSLHYVRHILFILYYNNLSDDKIYIIFSNALNLNNAIANLNDCNWFIVNLFIAKNANCFPEFKTNPTGIDSPMKISQSRLKMAMKSPKLPKNRQGMKNAGCTNINFSPSPTQILYLKSSIKLPVI